MKQTEDGGGKEEPKGGNLPTYMEDVLDDGVLSREARAAAGGCESPPEQAAYRRSREGNLSVRNPSIRKSEDSREESEASGD